MGDFTEAGRRFGSLISSQEVAPEAFFYLSSIAEREGRTDLALEGYSRLVEAGAGLVARGRAARLLLQKNERDAAFRMLDEHAAKDRSASLDVEFAKAALLEDVGKAPEAIAVLQLALERYPDHPGVRYQIALIQDKAGRTRIDRSFESLLKDRPEDASLLNALGYSWPIAARTATRRSDDPQSAAGVARQSCVSRQSRLGAVPSRDIRARATSRTRVSHLSRCRDCLALGRVSVAERKQADARALWARSLARSPDSKPLRATIERLTGTRMDPPEKKSTAPGTPEAEQAPPSDQTPSSTGS